MFETSERNGLGHSLLIVGVLSGILLGASLLATSAHAGEIPADQTSNAAVTFSSADLPTT